MEHLNNTMSQKEDLGVTEALQKKLSLQTTPDNTWRENELASLKDSIRNSVWKKLEEEQQVDEYPPSCFGKIPHFISCNRAAKKAMSLRELKTAKIVKVNPSLAQMQLRFLALLEGKTLLVPSPAVETDFFYLLNPKGEKIQKSSAHKWKCKKGAKKFGEVLLDDWSQVNHIDVYVVGSVAVSTDGTRLGKGMGYAELEWGILWELGVVNQDTTVITTVHQLQVVPVSTLNASQTAIHDLPVDIIVTPTRVINIKNRQPKPERGVLWDKLTPEVRQSPIIKILQEKRNRREMNCGSIQSSQR